MNNKSRLTAFLLMIAACISTALMLHYNSKRHHAMHKAKPKDPNLIVLNTSFRSFTPTGELHFKLFSPKAIHYPEKNSTVILKPQLIFYSDKRNEWRITADNALAQDGDNVVSLWGNVKIIQPKTTDSPETTITTTEITLYPKRSYAKTDQYVTINRENSTLRSKGMTVDFKKGILTTKSKTRGTYDPKDQ